MLASEHITRCQYLNGRSPREETGDSQKKFSTNSDILTSPFLLEKKKICSHIPFQQKGATPWPLTVTTFLFGLFCKGAAMVPFTDIRTHLVKG